MKFLREVVQLNLEQSVGEAGPIMIPDYSEMSECGTRWNGGLDSAESLPLLLTPHPPTPIIKAYGGESSRNHPCPLKPILN